MDTTASPTDVADILDRARERLTTVGWKQGGITPRFDAPACLYFTLRLVAGIRGDDPPTEAVVTARKLLIEELPAEIRRHGLTMWNDAAHRTLANVLDLIASARSKC